MQRHYKAVSAVAWSTSMLLFIMGAFEPSTTPHYNLYAFAVLSALIAVTVTFLCALESVVSRVFAREAANSRELLGTTVAAALADELEDRASQNGGSLHQIRR